MEKLQPRVVWITGASTGIGSALSEVFCRQGDDVVASARTESRLNELCKRLSSQTGSCTAVPCDLLSESSVTHASERIRTAHDHVDILINNAGVTYFKDFMSTSTEEFDHVLHTNLRGAFLATKSILPEMLKKKKGLILNIVSYAVKEVYTKSAAYAASKAGLEAMMNVLRAEVRRDGIQIVHVYPGAVVTPIWKQHQIEKYGSQMLTPVHIAEMVYQISIQPPSLMVEEIVLRPQGGDLQV